jgi:co-chaperonin GroES (HSP10)
MIQPLHDKVVVVKIKNDNKTASGIIVEKGLGEVDKAQVIAIGPKVSDVKVGDKVLIDWNKASQSKVTDDKGDIPVYILKEEFIVGVYQE